MSNENTLKNAIQPFVDAGELAGAAALHWRAGREPLVAAVGCRDLVRRLPVERDTLFRVASLSKPVTTLAALSLLDEGRFALDDPIATVAPELERLRVLRHPEGPLDECDDAVRPITFRHLLTHTAGLTYADFHHGPIGSAYGDRLGPHIDNPLTPDEWIARLASLPLIDQPGAAFHYGHSTDLLGCLMARLDAVPLSEVLSRRVLAPLGMRDTGFDVPASARERRAGLCGFDHAGRVAPIDVAPGGHALAERPADLTFQSGGQGLWSTLDDYLAFARLLLGDGDAAAPVLRPDTLATMTSNQLTAEQRASARLLGQSVFATGHGYGMGVAVVTDPGTADRLRGRGGIGTVGWPGAYGSWWQADPIERSVTIFLTHNMVGLEQMATGIGLGVWSAIACVHDAVAQGARVPEPRP